MRAIALKYPKSVQAATIKRKPKKGRRKVEYPKSVDAALRYEKAGMLLGYALLEECTDNKSVAQAHKKIQKAGCTITERRCQQLRVAASKFSPEEFFALNAKAPKPLAVSVFEEARDAKELGRIIDEAPDGQNITASYVAERAGRKKKPTEPEDEPSIKQHSDALELAERSLAAVRAIRRKIDDHTLSNRATKHVREVLIIIADEARAAANAIGSNSKDRASHLTPVA